MIQYKPAQAAMPPAPPPKKKKRGGNKAKKPTFKGNTTGRDTSDAEAGEPYLPSKKAAAVEEFNGG